MMKKSIYYILSILICLSMIICNTFIRNTIKANAASVITDEEGTTTYYIDVNGDNNNDGSFTAPLKDIIGIKNRLIKDYSENKLINKNIEVIINSGTYTLLDSCLGLTSSYLGNEDYNISFIGNGDVYLSGGVTLDNSKFYNTSVNGQNYYAYNLSEYNLIFNDSDIYLSPTVYINDSPLNIAQYPNNNSLMTNEILDKQLNSTKFTYKNIFDTTKINNNNLYVKGFFPCYYKHFTYKASVKNDTVKILEKVDFPFINNAKFEFLNDLSFLDTNNEYYIDYTNKILYLSPLVDLKNSTIELSLLNNAFARIWNINNISFENLNFKCCMLNGLRFQNCNKISIINCNFYNMPRGAIVQNDVTNSLIKNCNISNIGNCAIWVTGGDRATLTNSNNIISNNIITNTCRLYKGNDILQVYGIGSTVSDNTISEAPLGGILFSGNNHSITNNTIYNICTEGGDIGAIYGAGDWTARGNNVSENYIHDIKNSTYHQVVGIYLDNCFSSATVYNNLIDNVHTGMLFGGGRDNDIQFNKILNCNRSVLFDDRGINSTWFSIDNLKHQLTLVPYSSPLWQKEYPEITSLTTTNPALPYNNTFKNNTIFNCPKGPYIYDLVRQYGDIET